ncbi:MAG TPA: SURF1 family protein [Burkholderiales bacterium]|nr:SURF1 family protein [Burkholderiales bacterium]
MSAGPRFRPGAAVTVATIAFCALTVSLGVWQLRRATEKETLQAALDRAAAAPPVALPPRPVAADGFAQRRVVARGEYADRYTILLDNRVHRGRAGFHVVSPLRIAGGELYVLVDRGWVAAGRARQDLPRVATPAGEQTVEGLAVVPSARVYELSADTVEGRVWQNLVLDRYREWSKLELQPIVIQQTNDAGDGLVREWDRLDAGADRHRSYALQWFGFATLSVVLYVVLNLKRRG